MTLSWVHDCFMARVIKCPFHDVRKLNVSKWNQTQQKGMHNVNTFPMKV